MKKSRISKWKAAVKFSVIGLNPSTGEQIYNRQQNDGAERAGKNLADDAASEAGSEFTQKPVTDKATNDADDDIADQAEAVASKDLSAKPTRHSANDEYIQEFHNVIFNVDGFTAIFLPK